MRVPNQYRNSKVEEEVQKHYPAKISCWDSFKLFWVGTFCCCRCALTTRMKQLRKLKSRGEERLEKEMSLERIIKYLRDIRIYVKEKILANDDLLQFEIQHNHKNVIDLESSNCNYSD